jgi:hypothetical protein
MMWGFSIRKSEFRSVVGRAEENLAFVSNYLIRVREASKVVALELLIQKRELSETARLLLRIID